ncbi:putative short-chain dehydrogenase [Periconia macrospinosa]|uniref:Putative short-chain dehydrogenase n=1 Tax=Periconia macrospinosa TaxID=97972 RepID=A0A2V1DQT9_9PLEO|nr:putative short-chain dehydrogenase [Periconia macrospinosa]
MPSYLVTGAGRGLGLGFVTNLLRNKGNIVIATARDTAASSGLQELKTRNDNGRLILIDLDVSNAESVSKTVEEVAKVLPDGLDNLISNAGVSTSGPLKTFDELDLDEFRQEVDFPITTTLLVVRGFLPLVHKSKEKKILVISSIIGSLTIAPNVLDLGNGYAVARAALNMLVRKWSMPLKAKDIVIAVVHPGWVDSTEMGSSIVAWVDKNPDRMLSITVEQSAAGVTKVLHDLNIENTGSFFNYDGIQLPW